jgi:uncharacterized protein (DUF111 family)
MLCLKHIQMNVEKHIEERLAKAVEKDKFIKETSKKKVVPVDINKVMTDNSSQERTHQTLFQAQTGH